MEFQIDNRKSPIVEPDSDMLDYLDERYDLRYKGVTTPIGRYLILHCKLAGGSNIILHVLLNNGNFLRFVK